MLGFKSSIVMMAAACVFILFGLATAVGASQGWDQCSEMWVEGGWYPAEMHKSERVCREGHIAISYDTKMSLPAFSAFYITPDRVRQPGLPPGNFHDDPDLKAKGIAQRTHLPPAFHRTWNRGHLAPDQLMDWSYESRDSCYSAANYAPQGIKFNAGPWAELEMLVARYVSRTDNPLHIITGVAYNDREKPRVEEGVTIPDYFFMVLCDPAKKLSVGFIGNNENIVSWESHKMRPVQEIEALYGGRLFPGNVCRTASVENDFWWSGDEDPFS
jgi:DNA/RNA endonuclease G (NUC1)